jgi:hypothetical protein
VLTTRIGVTLTYGVTVAISICAYKHISIPVECEACYGGKAAGKRGYRVSIGCYFKYGGFIGYVNIVKAVYRYRFGLKDLAAVGS